jgi:hypothetical protein
MKKLNIPVSVVAHFLDFSPPVVTQMVARGGKLIAKMDGNRLEIGNNEIT